MSGEQPHRLAFVIGAGRSGTSLFSRWLSQLGLNFGPDVETISHINPDGNYEDKAIMQLHVDLLEANGFARWLDIPIHKPLEVPSAFAGRLDAAAEQMRSFPSPAAVKNPLASSFLPQWEKTLHDPLWLFVHRDVRLMVDSVVRLRERNQANRRNRLAGVVSKMDYRLSDRRRATDERRALTTWIRANGECVRFLRTLPADRVFVVEASSWPSQADAIVPVLEDRLEFTAADVDVSGLIRPELFDRDPKPLGDHGPELMAQLAQTQADLAALTAERGVAN